MSFSLTLSVEQLFERDRGERGPRWACEREGVGSIDVRNGRILEPLGIVSEINRDPINACAYWLDLWTAETLHS